MGKLVVLSDNKVLKSISGIQAGCHKRGCSNLLRAVDELGLFFHAFPHIKFRPADYAGHDLDRCPDIRSVLSGYQAFIDFSWKFFRVRDFDKKDLGAVLVPFHVARLQRLDPHVIGHLKNLIDELFLYIRKNCIPVLSDLLKIR